MRVRVPDPSRLAAPSGEQKPARSLQTSNARNRIRREIRLRGRLDRICARKRKAPVGAVETLRGGQLQLVAQSHADRQLAGYLPVVLQERREILGLFGK